MNINININPVFEEYPFNKGDLMRYQRYASGGWLETPEPGSTLYMGDMKAIESGVYEGDVLYVPRRFTYSDYNGSTCEAANRRYIIDEYLCGEDDEPDCEPVSLHIHPVYGGHGSAGIAFNVTKIDSPELAQELMEMWDDLERYPVVDEEYIYVVEEEGRAEFWENAGEHCFPRALGAAMRSIGARVWIAGDNSTEDNPLYDLFWALQREHMDDVYWYNEIGTSMHIDLEKLCSEPEKILEMTEWKAVKKVYRGDAPEVLMGRDWAEYVIEDVGGWINRNGDGVTVSMVDEKVHGYLLDLAMPALERDELYDPVRSIEDALDGLQRIEPRTQALVEAMALLEDALYGTDNIAREWADEEDK